MIQTKTKIGAVASSAFVVLLISCASDDRNSSEQSVVSQPTATTATGSVRDQSALANTEALLLAARASAGAARSDAKSCFDRVQACKGDAGTIDQSCLDMLQGCMPKAAPKPIDCEAISDLTPEQIGEIDQVVGVADDLIDDAIDFATGAIDALLDGGLALPDGGFPFPVGPGGGQAGRSGSRKDRGQGGADFGDAGWPVGSRAPSSSRADAGAVARPTRDAQVPSFPTIDPDAAIPGGELCGVALPAIPVGALAACADKAAAGLRSGGDLLAIANDAFTCIEAPFKDDIAKLCAEGKAECGKAGAPPNICANVTEICGALAP